jgi:cytochrome c
MKKTIDLVAFAMTATMTFAAHCAEPCNATEGQRLFQEQQCAGCHTYVPKDYDKSGPNLARLFGRKAGTAVFPAGYSVALKQSGITWNAETLDKWLTNPAAMVAGTAMPYAGLPDAAARKTLICFLQQKTK